MGRKEYIDKLATQLKELDDKIIKIENSAEKVTGNLKSEYNTQLSSLNAKKNEMKIRLKELNESNQEAFSVLKEGFSNSYKDLKDAVEKAAKKYKSNGN